MRAIRSLALVLSLIGVSAAFVPAQAADPPAKQPAAKQPAHKKKPMGNPFDANHNGKIGPRERTRAQVSRAPLRQQRALMRNAWIINSIR